jgi:hypothetical protein
MSTHDFASRRIGELLDDAIALVVANWRTIVPVSAAVVLPAAAAYSVVASFYIRSLLELVGTAASSRTTLNSGDVTLLATAALMQGLSLLYMLSRVVFDAALFSSSPRLLERERVPLKQALRGGLSSVLPLIAVQFLVGLASGGAGLAVGIAVGLLSFALLIASPIAGTIGLVLAYVLGLGAGVAVAVLLSMAAPIVVIEKSLGTAIPRSFRMVRRHFWRVLLIMVAASLLAGQFESALATPTIIRSVITGVQSPQLLLGGLAWGWKVFDGLMEGIAIALAMPFATAVSLLTYFDLRARDEGMDLVVRARGLLAG